MVTTTINSLPSEILFLILEFASSPRSELLIQLRNIHITEELDLIKELLFESNSVLCDSALVCKSWTHSAQTLLLQSVKIDKDESFSYLFNAPLSQFQVNHLYLMMPDTPETENSQVGNLLSKLNGLKSLQLRNNFRGRVEQVLDLSVFLTPGLSELESLTLSNLSIIDENNFPSTTPTFKLRELTIEDVFISDTVLDSFVTPALTKLSITQSLDSDQHFVNVFRLAAPHLKILLLNLESDRDAAIYVPIIPLCTSITKFSFFFSDPSSSFLSIISAFAANQLLHLKLFFHYTEDLPNLLTVLSLPSLRKLQSLTLIAYKQKETSLEEVAVPVEVVAECTRRGIIYEYVVETWE